MKWEKRHFLFFLFTLFYFNPEFFFVKPFFVLKSDFRRFFLRELGELGVKEIRSPLTFGRN